ncbi:hypothetical protein ACFQL7_03110 [Halocatena marina]|uniref:Uncharacterized protein n=1 Tax=Halocatena marina TaxID=2934937 RepID=A0ABD5YLQ3_9EURY
MAFTLRETLRSGLSRVRSRNGAILIGTFALISLFQGGFVWIISAMYVPLGSNALASTPAGPTPGTALPASWLFLRFSLQALRAVFSQSPYRLSPSEPW